MQKAVACLMSGTHWTTVTTNNAATGIGSNPAVVRVVVVVVSVVIARIKVKIGAQKRRFQSIRILGLRSRFTFTFIVNVFTRLSIKKLRHIVNDVHHY